MVYWWIWRLIFRMIGAPTPACSDDFLDFDYWDLLTITEHLPVSTCGIRIGITAQLFLFFIALAILTTFTNIFKSYHILWFDRKVWFCLIFIAVILLIKTKATRVQVVEVWKCLIWEKLRKFWLVQVFIDCILNFICILNLVPHDEVFQETSFSSFAYWFHLMIKLLLFIFLVENALKAGSCVLR